MQSGSRLSTTGSFTIRRPASDSRGNSAMLAPLGFYLFTMVMTCSIVMLSCWVYDTNRVAIEAWRSRPADLGFDLDSISHEWRPYSDSTDEFGCPVEHAHAA
jgi:hypothetical protein